MSAPHDPEAYREYSLLLALLFALIFLSPLADWWMGRMGAWYLPYLLWGGVLVLGALMHWRCGGSSGDSERGD